MDADFEEAVAEIDDALGEGWERHVHFRPGAGTIVDEHRGELILSGDDAPLRPEPHHVEWWYGEDALRVYREETGYEVADVSDDTPPGLERAEGYLREIGYEPVSPGTEMMQNV
ncbi:MAG: hypothetical protein SVQ76_01030 [Candidatus Nanohaloarchaea archaeon]|nr:hypothetical protein [Candidatus Nanohaloarchaea archaeon]